MGVFVLLTSAILLFAGIYVLAGFSQRLLPSVPTAVFTARLLASVASLAVVGWGLMYLRKWAALVFSAVTACLAFESIREGIRGSFRPSLGDWYWLCFAYALVLFCPAVLTVRCWRYLTWSAKLGASRAAANEKD
jgi:hypothetical protein